MAQFYVMPAISPTMEVGSLVAWRIPEGDAFESSAVIAEIGTDKATMEAEIFDDGVMIKHLIAEGDEVPPGYPIAIFGESKDDDIAALLAEFEKTKAAADAAPAADDAPAQAAPEAAATPAPVAAKRAAPTKAIGLKPTEWMGAVVDDSVLEPPGDIGAANVEPGRVLASPLARKLAGDLGVNLHRLNGSGPGGRIVKADVEGAPRGGGQTAGPPPADEVVRNSPMRKTIAKRLLESHSEIPVFFLTVDLDVAGMVAFRKQLKAADVKVSYNTIFTKCAAKALREFPRANASWNDQSITRHGSIDIGIAVALPDGLITPIVRNCDAKDMQTIGAEIRELAGRAKSGQLKPEEYTGNTFTISNLGMMGIEEFTAIINPSASAILAVGGIR